jgi:hypothetical protein
MSDLARVIFAASGVWLLLAGQPSANSTPSAIEGQIDAGLLASGRDREMAVNYDASANRTEVSMTVAPSGPAGAMPRLTLVFVGQFAGRTPGAGPTTLAVRTHIAPRSDPRDRDPRTGVEGRELVFQLDPHTDSGITLYMYAASWGYSGFVPPGDEIPVAFFAFMPAELRALGAARLISGRALGSDFTLGPDQLDALREFARRVVR